MLDIVPESVLGRTAFMLLSSSSANHYIQSAIAAGPSSRIEYKIDIGVLTHEELVEHASSLWSTIVHATKRDIPEVELAILLPILARVAADSEETRRLIRSISVHDEAPAIWLSALARKLWRQMPSDTSYDSGYISHVVATYTGVMYGPIHSADIIGGYEAQTIYADDTTRKVEMDQCLIAA